jgi:hypothetical protein
MTLLCCLIALSAHASNSLVRYEDVPQMQALGVSPDVINYFVKHQTCSITSGDVIRMKKSGLTNDAILSAIQADRYEPEAKPTALEEAELIAKLKEAGMSDEAVLQFIGTVKKTRAVDASGNTRYTFSTESRRPYTPTAGSVFPEVDHYRYDRRTGRFLFLLPPASPEAAPRPE